ncbi:tRNA1(Val) (adenine(37)-N6)-methyltransferase [Paenibacillus allorhizosphaerae]|uniref:tRNA1(Val) (Adenine(37)-N6)-methyltransferase n=1 Tax=Paenibacillus allorhizosphaerae TaxID=2849866 RepID=A0ABM8VS82_9BACL|nr:tRNA1(Val) (adenine(37)-N6)-methyltransferase [Paenibacillus allorhizosphaerae]
METIPLHASERVDDLLTQQLKIIQSEEVFSFSLDAVLLARFCQLPPRGRIADLCTGNGVIPLLLTTRTKAHITCVEIQERLADMAHRNVRLNGLEERITVVHGDLRDAVRDLGNGVFDVVTINPPYLPVPSGEQNENLHVAAARHEVFCTLDDVVRVSSRLVRSGGRVAMVHRPSRLVEIFAAMREHRLEPKRIRFVHPRADSEANMVLIEALRDGKPEVRLLPPLIVYKNGTEYSDELIEIYYGKREALIDEEMARRD